MKRDISPDVTQAALDAIDTLAELNSYHELGLWSQIHLKRAIPHHGLECGSGSVTATGLRVSLVRHFDIPQSYFAALAADRDVRAPFIENWLLERQPQWVDASATDIAGELWAQVLRRIELDSLAFHAVMSSDRAMTFFGFYRLPRPLSAADRYLLHLITPHIHVAAMRFSKRQSCSDRMDMFDIAQREREILGWLHLGKTNWEIGQLLRISDKTVKNHIQNIFSKFDVHNRVQLVTKAIELELIERRCGDRGPFGL